MIYLDHAASTPPFPEVAELASELIATSIGNPSGAHGASQRASKAIEDARESLAGVIGAKPGEVIFTSGGSESDNFALKGTVWACERRPVHVVASAIEHHAVLDTAEWLCRQGHDVGLAPVGSDGAVEPDGVAALCRPDTALVSIMLVNNETGVIQPVAEVAEAIRNVAPNALVHTDAAQALRTIDLAFAELGVDLLTLSGHKFGGLQGTGVLVVRDGVKLDPLIHGGGQELGRRAGTSNVAGYAALGLAAELAASRRSSFISDATALTARLLKGLETEVDGWRVNGAGAEKVPHITSMCFEGVRSEDLVVLLDREGIAVSAGSSCASGATEPSHVLEAMGIPDDISRGAVRVSTGFDTRPEDIASAAAAIAKSVRSLRGDV